MSGIKAFTVHGALHEQMQQYADELYRQLGVGRGDILDLCGAEFIRGAAAVYSALAEHLNPTKDE